MDVALAGLKTLAATTAGAKVSGEAFKKPITNFYQTDPISRAYVPVVNRGPQILTHARLDLLRWHSVRARSSRTKRMCLVEPRRRQRRTRDRGVGGTSVCYTSVFVAKT